MSEGTDSLPVEIYHIANTDDLQRADVSNTYSCDSLKTEGFIHCCTADQLSGVVERYYQNAGDLILLVINPERLNSSLVFENTVGGAELFPHCYGEIEMSAVDRWENFSSDQRDSVIALLQRG